MKSKYICLAIVLVALFFFLRIYHLEDSFNFGSDQGMTLLETYNLFQSKQITLISQTGSSWTADGRYIFFSSLLYYILMPVLILFSWDPLSVSYFLIILQFIALAAVFWVIWKRNNIEEALIFSVLFISNLSMVEHSRYVWTPNFLIPLAGIVLALLLLLSKRKNLSVIALLIGTVWGLGFQMHYSFVLVVLITIVWLFLGKYFRGKEYLCLFFGFTLMMLPLIVFELRHNFYNLRTAAYIFQAKKSMSQSQIFQFHPHYFLTVAPFFLYVVSKIIIRLKKINRHLIYLLLFPFLFYCLRQILPIPSNGYTMVSGWNYQGVKKTRDIILSVAPTNYNIVDLMTGDTRAMALRYLLTIAGNPPLGVVEYPNASMLFIYSKVPVDNLLEGSMWELDVFKPAKVIKSWRVQNDINLYLIARETKSL